MVPALDYILAWLYPLLITRGEQPEQNSIDLANRFSMLRVHLHQTCVADGPLFQMEGLPLEDLRVSLIPALVGRPFPLWVNPYAYSLATHCAYLPR